MKEMDINKAFTLMESGPVVLVTTNDGKSVQAPLIKECLANIECKVIDIVKKHNIIVLDGIVAYVDEKRKEKRTLHAVGDGTFIVDGRRLSRKRMMRSKLPPGIQEGSTS